MQSSGMQSSGEGKIRKAVIPAAGLGTRFLPATKAVPKELLPIVDQPTIQYIVEEAVGSGIETIILIAGKGKSSIEDHFDQAAELEEKLERDGKQNLVDILRRSSNMAQVVSVRQGVPRGLGHAVLCARELVGNEPFVVLLGDDLVDSKDPCTKQMIEVFEEYRKPVVALMEVADEDVSKFGICGGKELAEGIFDLDTMVEKPPLAEAPSKLAIVGRYVLTPRIFEILAETKPGKGGEIQLTDAMAQLMREEGFIGYRFRGERHDAGDKFGFMKANIAFALKRDELSAKLTDYIKHLASTL